MRLEILSFIFAVICSFFYLHFDFW